MENFTAALERILMPVSQKITNIKSLQAVASGFMSILPVTIIGSVFYLIGNFPIEGWTNWLIANGIQDFIMIAYNVTLGIMSVYAAFVIGYSYGHEEGQDALGTAIISLICFFILTPYTTGADQQMLYNFNWLSSKGLFVAIITSISAVKICLFVSKKGWTIKMPAGVPPFVERTFASLIPGLSCAFIFTIIAYLFSLTSFGNIHELIFNFLQVPLNQLGGSLAGYLIATVMIQLLWWFGIHGFNVVASIMMPIWLGIDMARLAGETASPLGMSMLTVVGQSTISCCIVMIFFCKSNQLKEIGKIATPAALFNIGEPIVFGVPNVLNPYMFIPTVFLVPIVTNLFFYLGFVSGILPPLSGVQIPMQMPVILYGLVQGNWMVAVWQALAIPLAVFLYLPFYKMYDKTLIAKEHSLDELDELKEAKING